MVALELIDNGLLQIPIDRQGVIFVEFLFDRLAADDLPHFGHGAALCSKQRAFQSRLAAIRSEDVRQRRVHRIRAHDVAFRIFLVERERAAFAVVNPTAQSRFGKPSIAQVFVAQLLKLRVTLRGIARPVNMKSKDEDGRDREQPAPRAQAAIRGGRAQTLAHFLGQIPRRSCDRGRRSPRAVAKDGNHQKQRDDCHSGSVNQRQPGRELFRRAGRRRRRRRSLKEKKCERHVRNRLCGSEPRRRRKQRGRLRQSAGLRRRECADR